MKRLLLASVCIVGFSNVNASAGEQVNWTGVKTNHMEKFEPLFEDTIGPDGGHVCLQRNHQDDR